MSDTDDLIAALAPVASAFQQLDVSFYIGGSVASTYHGAIRSTMDVDLVCDLRADQVGAFVASFGPECYVSESAVRDAVERRSCFNVIHLPTAFKVDVFVSRGRPFDLAAMQHLTWVGKTCPKGRCDPRAEQGAASSPSPGCLSRSRDR